MRGERDPIEVEHCFECGAPLGEGHAPDCKVGDPNRPEKYEERPGPKTNRRFETSREPALRKRLKAVKKGFRGLSENYDEVIAVTLYGSTVTGHATEESDLDNCIFVDPSKASQRNPKIEVNTIHRTSERGTILSSTGFDKETGIDYVTAFHDAVSNADPDTPEDFVSHASVYAISNEIIDHHVDDYVEFIKVALDYVGKKMEYEDYINGGGNKTTAPEVPKQPQRKEIGSNIPAMFHLQVGHGLDKYREYLIEKLVGLGDLGLQVWKGIIRIVEATEQYDALGTDKTYPRTLAEAKKTYCRNSDKEDKS